MGGKDITFRFLQGGGTAMTGLGIGKGSPYTGMARSLALRESVGRGDWETRKKIKDKLQNPDTTEEEINAILKVFYDLGQELKDYKINTKEANNVIKAEAKLKKEQLREQTRMAQQQRNLDRLAMKTRIDQLETWGDLIEMDNKKQKKVEAESKQRDKEAKQKKPAGIFQQISGMLNQQMIDMLANFGVPMSKIRVGRFAARGASNIEQGGTLLSKGGGKAASAATSAGSTAVAAEGAGGAGGAMGALGAAGPVAIVIAIVGAILVGVHMIGMKLSETYRMIAGVFKGLAGGLLDTALLMIVYMAQEFFKLPEVLVGLFDVFWVKPAEFINMITAQILVGYKDTKEAIVGAYETSKEAIFGVGTDIKEWWNTSVWPLLSPGWELVKKLAGLMSTSPFGDLFQGKLDLSKFNLSNLWSPSKVFDWVAPEGLQFSMAGFKLNDLWNPLDVFDTSKLWDFDVGKYLGIKGQFSIGDLINTTLKWDFNVSDLVKIAKKISLSDIIDTSTDSGGSLAGDIVDFFT